MSIARIVSKIAYVVTALMLAACTAGRTSYTSPEDQPLEGLNASNQNGRSSGDRQVSDTFSLYGDLDGTIIVTPGGQFNLFGHVRKDVVLQSGAKAHLYGSVNGNVYNRGGNLRVYGTIDGQVFTETGTTFIDPKADIRGNTRP